MSPESVLDTIGLAQFARIWDRYRSTVTPDRREKYLALEYWIEVSIGRAHRLGLDTGQRRRVLDLGCGCGYFLYVCKLLGHDVLGLDCPEPRAMYTEVRELLGVPWVAHEIRPFVPLPALGPFDVVTAHMVCFNGHRTWQHGDAPSVEPPNLWGPTEWSWLFEQVAAPVWHLELNDEQDGTLFPPGLREFFLDRGAKIDGHRVLIA